VIDTIVKQPNTIVRCCILGNKYQIVAQNMGNKKDIVIITLGTNYSITEWYPIMDASLPTEINGGVGGNFITFKIDELIPNIALCYIIQTSFDAEKPRKFTAWSVETGDVEAIFTGQCPAFGIAGPKETISP
jgi:hypothetical protein